jgi:inhibitor of KinA
MTTMTHLFSSQYTLNWLGDAALELRFAHQENEYSDALVHEALDTLRHASLSEVIDWVPGFVSLTLVLNSNERIDQTLFARKVQNALEQKHISSGDMERRVVHIPVCYGLGQDHDLNEVAAHLHLSIATLVEKLSAIRYRVAFIGPLPGFPYLQGLDSSLSVPRRNQVRAMVPAGSVVISGRQTGIYPCESASSWRVLGGIKVSLFDAKKSKPSLLSAGDYVCFRPVKEHELERAKIEVRDA